MSNVSSHDIAARMGIAAWDFRVVFGRTRIDYDPEKEGINRDKHHYSLQSAVPLLERIVFAFGKFVPCITSDGFMKGGEARHMHMTLDDAENVVLMVTTMRPDEVVRIISYRRASEEEAATFFCVTGYPARA